MKDTKSNAINAYDALHMLNVQRPKGPVLPLVQELGLEILYSQRAGRGLTVVVSRESVERVAKARAIEAAARGTEQVDFALVLTVERMEKKLDAILAALGVTVAQ